MRKSLFSIMLIIVLVMGVGAMAFASPSTDDIGYEVTVTSPYAQWVDTDPFVFDVNASEGFQNFYEESRQFEVHSTTYYRIELQLLSYSGPQGIKLIQDNSIVTGTLADLFEVQVRGWGGWKKLKNFQTAVDYNTLNGSNFATLNVDLKLILADGTSNRLVWSLPSGQYGGYLRLVVSEKL